MNNDNRDKLGENGEDRFSTLDIDGINDLYYQDQNAEPPNNNHKRPPNSTHDLMKIVALLASIIVLIFVIYTAIVGILGSHSKITIDGTTTTASIESPFTSSSVTTSVLATSATSTLLNVSTSTTDSISTTKTTVTTQTTSTTATTVNPSYKDAVIFIDAGHGGKDPGAVGSLDGTNYYEEDINLAVALLVRDELEKKGFTVVMSRETDVFVELEDRVKLAQEAEADMFISLHCNSAVASAYGPRILYTDRSVSYSKEKFATYFKTELDKVTESYPNMRKAFVRSDVDESGYKLAVLCDTKMPSVLIEMGFITNTNDLKMLTSEWWQLHAAKAIANAIESAFNAGIVTK